jgi:arsenate reductase
MELNVISFIPVKFRLPRKLSDELAAEPAVLVTIGCGENCPPVPRLKFIDWSIANTKGQPVETIRQIRD